MGFDYVEFDDSSSAASALTTKNGALIDSRQLSIDYYTPRKTEEVVVRDLVKRHMNNHRSIILAVVSAERDPAVQVSSLISFSQDRAR